ncbi:MAG: zonular occludens toxin domain-containing protein [Magnetococcus sp. WYHC-3]
MLSLITGTPGAGKTLIAVWDIYCAVQAGRLVYARVEGINIPGVQPFPDDGWTSCKDGSLVVIDEAQELWPRDKDRTSALPKTEIEAMERHRHRGMDIICITQHPSLINAHILALVGKHRHLVRVMGTANVRLFTMDQASERLSKSDLRAALVQPWRHPKQVFGMYRSAQLHPPRQPVPKLLVLALLAVVGLSSYAVWGIGNFFGAAGEDQEEPVKKSSGVSSAVPAIAWAEKHTGAVLEEARRGLEAVETVTGCYADRLRCRCVGARAREISEAQCRGLIGSPIRTAASAEAVVAAQERRGTRSDRAATDGLLASLPGVGGSQ